MEAQHRPRHTLNTTQIGIMILVLHTTKDPLTMIRVLHATESSITTTIIIMAEIQVKVIQLDFSSL